MTVQRRALHWALDRCRTLAKQGRTDEQISTETGLPLINVQVYTHGIKRHGNQATEKRETHDRQIREDDTQADSAERAISQPEDRSTKID